MIFLKLDRAVGVFAWAI